MKWHGPLILQVDRLEDRTCPSLFGPEALAAATGADGSIDTNAPADVVPWGMESSGNPYDWVMMVMNPDQMMALTNEYDQSPGSDSMRSPIKQVTDAFIGMTSQGVMPEAIGESMDESGTMPPAQMVMEQPPLVRRSLSPAKTAAMSEMTDSDNDEEDSKSGSGDAMRKSGANGEAPNEDQPPVLSPGELELRLDPQLGPGPIEPELEQALPSGEI